jgi:hypothetical protein
MTEVARITPQEARPRVLAGRALWMCAYEDPACFAENRLEGAISLQEFRTRRRALPTGEEIVFYCA